MKFRGKTVAVESVWNGHGEPKIEISVDGMIDGIGVTENLALIDFCWRNNICVEEIREIEE